MLYGWYGNFWSCEKCTFLENRFFWLVTVTKSENGEEFVVYPQNATETITYLQFQRHPPQLFALADPGGHAHPQTFDEFFVFCKKTDFWTNWPTPQVVIMQKGVQWGSLVDPTGLSDPRPPLWVHTPCSPCGPPNDWLFPQNWLHRFTQ